MAGGATTANITDARALNDPNVQALLASLTAGVSITSGGTIAVSGTATAPILDVIPANLAGIPQSGVTGLVTALAGKLTGLSAADTSITVGGTATAPTLAVAPANLTGIPQAGVTGLVAALAAKAPSTGIATSALADPYGFGLVMSAPPNVGATPAVWPAGSSTVYIRATGSGSVSNFILNLAVSSGNYDIGVYTNSGAGIAAVPSGSKVTSKGTTPMPSAGVVTLALGSTQAVNHGANWLAMAVDNATASITKTTVGTAGLSPGFVMTQTTSGYPLPASVGTLVTVNYVPIILTS